MSVLKNVMTWRRKSASCGGIHHKFTNFGNPLLAHLIKVVNFRQDLRFGVRLGKQRHHLVIYLLWLTILDDVEEGRVHWRHRLHASIVPEYMQPLREEQVDLWQ